MPFAIKIDTLGTLNTTIVSLNRIKKKLPQNTKDGMRKFGMILERDIKISAKQELSKFTGTLTNRGIRYEQGKRSDNGALFIRKYGLQVDSMKPHYVSVRKSRTVLLRWASQARSSYIRENSRKIMQGKIKRFSIYVKPHPFIRKGWRRARPKLNPIIKRYANKALTKF